MGATLQLGLPPTRLVGKPRDYGNAANQPEAGPTDQERAAFVAGSQAWLEGNPDEQARANFAEIEKASAEALKEAHAFSAHCSKYKSPGADPDRRMPDASDHRLATTLRGLEERRVILLQAVEDWGQSEPCDEHTEENGGKT